MGLSSISKIHTNSRSCCSVQPNSSIKKGSTASYFIVALFNEPWGVQICNYQATVMDGYLVNHCFVLFAALSSFVRSSKRAISNTVHTFSCNSAISCSDISLEIDISVECAYRKEYFLYVT